MLYENIDSHTYAHKHKLCSNLYIYMWAIVIRWIIHSHSIMYARACVLCRRCWRRCRRRCRWRLVVGFCSKTIHKHIHSSISIASRRQTHEKHTIQIRYWASNLGLKLGNCASSNRDEWLLVRIILPSILAFFRCPIANIANKHM